jgi:outer membrane protein assembly factor BamB
LNTKKLILISLFALGSLILSACTGRTVANSWPGLSADGEHAYVSEGSFVYSVDLKTGKEVWRYPAAVNSAILYFAPPVLTSDGQLLIGSAGKNHDFISLNTATGKENWAKPFSDAKGGWVAAPLVLNNKIYAPNTDGFLYILDMSGAQTADPVEITGALWSAPVTDGKVIYISSLDHHLHVFDPATHKLGEPVDVGGAIPSSPTVGTDGAYVGTFTSTIEFIKPNSEHKVLTTAETKVWGSPIFDNGTLYYADLNGKVYSLDIASGKQNWSVNPTGSVVASLLLAGDQIYVASEPDSSSTSLGTLAALDREGKTIWSKEVGGKLYTTPVASSDLIIVAPYKADFVLAAYDAQGKQAWTFIPAK